MQGSISRLNFISKVTGGILDRKDNSGKVSAEGKPEVHGIKSYSGKWGESQQFHLIRRCLFGATHEDLAFFSAKTLEESLDILLTQSPAPEPPVNDYDNEQYKDPEVPFGKTWVHSPFGDPEGPQDALRVFSLKSWWIGLMIHQDRSLTEKMTLFWSNFLASQFCLMKDARLDYSYVELLREYSLGNFKKLVREMTTNPGMMEYLNTNVNTATAPNENYSRELQELFTVGKGPDSKYTESDVKEAARVLTGWKIKEYQGVGSEFKPEEHDTGDKHFSAFYDNAVIKGRNGQDGATETDELIDMIFKRREVAKYTCRNLYRWFVYYEIDEQVELKVIGPLADVFIANNFELKPVLRVLLGSEHFFSDLSMGCQIKSPADLLIGAFRQFGEIDKQENAVIKHKRWNYIYYQILVIGMEIGDPPNVCGWSAYHQYPLYSRAWINSTTLTKRNMTTDCLVSEKGLAQEGFVSGFDILNFVKKLSEPADCNKLIEESCRYLSALPLDEEHLNTLKSILLSNQSADYYWTAAWNEYLSDPEDEVKKNIIISRLSFFYRYIMQRSEFQLT